MRPATAIATISVIIVALAAGARFRHAQDGKTAEPSWNREGFLPSNPTGGPLWDSAESLWNLGRLEEAGRLFDSGATLHPLDAAWPQALAECLAGQGRHEQALAALERCRSIAPLSPEALARRRASRLEVGFAKAGGGDPWTARQMADAVLQEAPGDSMARLLEGYAWAMEGALPNAEKSLRSLVEAHPGQIEAYPILAQCAFRRGDAEAATEWIERLGRIAPAYPGLALLLEQAAQLRGGRGAFSSRLRVICDGDCPLGLEREVLDAAERAWSALQHDLGRAPSSAVSIRVVQDGSMPTEWAEAVFDGQVRLPLESAQDPTRRDHVLRHELAHAFLGEISGGRIPLWLNEGLAQWLEGKRPVGSLDASSAAWLDELPSRRQFMDLPAGDADLAYAYSLAVTDELMSLHGSTTVVRYLELLAGGSPDTVCFAQTFGRTYRDLSGRIRSRM